MPGLITLTTDFGQEDPFVGVMKGVILNIAADARLIDITHSIKPQNIEQAARAIEAAYRFFPDNTIHLVVVDPEVGGIRRPIALKSGLHTFVGPDNGVFTSVITEESQVYELTEKKYFLDRVSNTFHGRDIFAPAAAWLATGVKLSDMGRRIKNPKTLELALPHYDGKTLNGKIVYIDRFGNLATNITANDLETHFPKEKDLQIRIGRKTLIDGIDSSYSQRKPGEGGAIINSWDALEIFLSEGNAAEILRITTGAPVTVSKQPLHVVH